MNKVKSVYGDVMPIDFVNELGTLVERLKKKKSAENPL